MAKKAGQNYTLHISILVGLTVTMFMTTSEFPHKASVARKNLALLVISNIHYGGQRAAKAGSIYGF